METQREKNDLQIVTVDGPGGAGKSTVGRMLARRLNYIYLDTGAMYRAVALLARRRGVDLEDERGLEKLCRGIQIAFPESPEGQRVSCQGEDITEAIRDPEVGWMASVVSLKGPVREAMVALQRQVGARGGVVAEGRDTGTVVFPRARHKFFLVAQEGERALRRYRELKNKGLEVSLEGVEKELRERDAQDSSRRLAPLRPAHDAHLLDSTGLNPEEVVERMLEVIRRG